PSGRRTSGPRAKPTRVRDQFVELGTTRLHYVEWGSAEKPPMLLLHGGSAHAHWWDFVAGDLTATHRVLALDLRGHGDSGWPADAVYDLDAHVGDVLGLL